MHRNLIDQLPQRIFIKDRNLQYMDCNKRFADDLGITPDQIVGKNDFDFFPAELAEAYRADDRDVLTSGSVKEVEEPFASADGQRWIRTSKTPFRDHDEEIMGVIGIFTDITEQKQRETEYRTIIQTSLDGFWLNDVEGRFLDVNDALCRMLGYSREELLRMHIRDIEAEESSEETKAHIETILKTGGDRFLTRHRRKNGKIIDVEISSRYEPSLGEKFFVFVRNVTREKHARDRLQASADRQRAILDGLDALVYVTDMETYELLFINKYGREVW